MVTCVGCVAVSANWEIGKLQNWKIVSPTAAHRFSLKLETPERLSE